MMTRPAYYLVIDLEATCDRDHALPREETEIIEIGAVLARGRDFGVEDEFQTFIRPVAHPRLTPFCTELTSITQADVDAAPTFPAAVAKLRMFIGGRDVLFCSWGNYDRSQFERDARRHRVALPFGGRHLNLKAQYLERFGEGRRSGMAGVLGRFGLALEGTHHRGIDDARNIAKLLPYVLGDAKAGPGARGRVPALRRCRVMTCPRHGGIALPRRRASALSGGRRAGLRGRRGARRGAASSGGSRTRSRARGRWRARCRSASRRGRAAPA